MGVLTSSDPAEKEKKLAAEIANGRLAMVSIIGMFFQDGLTGSAWGDWSLYEASPPLGFWDPLGLSVYKDDAIAVQQFTRRRAIELQHGRVSMIACIGYMVPEFFKWPGYLSPSQGLAFEDIPNGLKACAAVPFLGWTQIIAFVGILEVTNLGTTPTGVAGDFENFGAYGIPGAKGLAA